MILVLKKLAVTKKNEILPKITADHNPVLWTMKNMKSTYLWQLNLLHSQEVLSMVKNETKSYFEMNLEHDVSIHNVWDAYKVVLRGILMKLNYEQKKKINTLQELIK